jgi:hypothetical protein
MDQVFIGSKRNKQFEEALLHILCQMLLTFHAPEDFLVEPAN